MLQDVTNSSELGESGTWQWHLRPPQDVAWRFERGEIRGCLQPEKTLLGSENGIFPKVASTDGMVACFQATNGLVIDRPMNLLDLLDPTEKSMAPAGLISS